ncbi:folylpolyglutamate synthase/dihydrofolate synthase family protein [Leptobacterium sp. I13]|uniref:bifunctional folylpolyglutamate synthase/dihydrofolate synthase n=1 Tax=Leptobacterium meishanense TaxID=3128904 RepID=UPI0030EB4376
MNYKETLDWMFGRLPMYQQQGKTALKNKLDNIQGFSKFMGNPEKKFKSIHVAGTNGKGSVSHMVASILQESGYKTGLYTSPHLKDFRERIKVNGLKIPEAFVVQFIDNNKQFLEQYQLSFFEMTVGMAFDYFAKEKVDIAIVETGLGGRLDSTNIIIPEVAVITNIGYDHKEILGNTLEQIALEKAGIFKQEVPVVIGEYQEETMPVFLKVAKDRNASVFLAEELVKKEYGSDLLGNYQKKNSKTAVATVQQLKDFEVTLSAIKKGLSNVVKNTSIEGRWQQLGIAPRVICDVAHNKEGIGIIMQQLQEQTYDKLHIVLGFVKEKELDEILPLFPKSASYYFCKPNIPRGLDVNELHRKAVQNKLKGNKYATVLEAYTASKRNAKRDDLIFIGGSNFVVAETL